MGSLVSSIAGAFTGNDVAKQADLVQPVTQEQLNADRQRSIDQLGQYNQFLGALSGQGALDKQLASYNNFSNMASGQGPSAAQNMLNQSMGQNVAGTAAAMAGQRNSGSNSGMIARQIGQMGANTSQQAAGQAATLKAQEQIAGMQGQGAMANQMTGNLMQGQGAALGGTQNLQGMGLGAVNGYNQAQVSNNAAANQANLGLKGQIMGGLLQGAGAAGAAMLMPAAAKGGAVEDVPKIAMANGGVPPPAVTSQPSSLKRFLEGSGPTMMANGGAVPALVSPGERYLSPEKVAAVAKGADPIAIGEKIPGKPKVAGAKNSYANDTVPKTLEEGGIVLPRSVTQAKHPHWEAHKFVAAIMKKQALKGK